MAADSSEPERWSPQPRRLSFEDPGLYSEPIQDTFGMMEGLATCALEPSAPPPAIPPAPDESLDGEEVEEQELLEELAEELAREDARAGVSLLEEDPAEPLEEPPEDAGAAPAQEAVPERVADMAEEGEVVEGPEGGEAPLPYAVRVALEVLFNEFCPERLEEIPALLDRHPHQEDQLLWRSLGRCLESNALRFPRKQEVLEPLLCEVTRQLLSTDAVLGDLSELPPATDELGLANGFMMKFWEIVAIRMAQSEGAETQAVHEVALQASSSQALPPVEEAERELVGQEVLRREPLSSLEQQFGERAKLFFLRQLVPRDFRLSEEDSRKRPLERAEEPQKDPEPEEVARNRRRLHAFARWSCKIEPIPRE